TMGGPVSYIPTSVVMSSTTTLDVLFSAGQLPDQTCYLITIGPGTMTQTLGGDLDCKVRVLVGDTTGSGDVKLSDAVLTKAKIGAAVASNARFDIDLSGNIVS